MEIKTVRDFTQALRQGRFASLGSYPLFYLMADGAVMCPPCAYRERFTIGRAIRDGYEKQWIAVAYDVYWEGPPEDCCECNEPIESAYGDPNEETCAGEQ